jgi:RNase P subunit RPR2
MRKLSKEDAKKEIAEFFANIREKTPEEIRKIKKIAMSSSIQLKELRKKFCKKCLMPYKNPKVRIKNKTKIVVCNNCGYTSRFKLKD